MLDGYLFEMRKDARITGSPLSIMMESSTSWITVQVANGERCKGFMGRMLHWRNTELI